MRSKNAGVWLLAVSCAFVLGMITNMALDDSPANADPRPGRAQINKFEDIKEEREKLPDTAETMKEEKVLKEEASRGEGKEDNYQSLSFAACRSLPKDRNRAVDVPMADERLRQELITWHAKPYLAKQAHGKPNMLFFMGLEGTGHHLIDTAFKGVCTMPQNKTVSACRSATHVLPNYIGNQGARWDFTKLSKAEQPRVDAFMREIAEHRAFATDVLFLNSMRHDDHIFLDSALSYPDGGHPRIDNYPDARFLAEQLEKAGMDLKIVLLTRDLDALMVSTVLNRGFEPNFYNQAHIFEFMLEAMIAQLSTLDPNFIAGCLRLDASQDEFSMRLDQIERNLQSSIKFKQLVLAHWKQKTEAVCINPDDIHSRLLYKLGYLNKKLHSFCP